MLRINLLPSYVAQRRKVAALRVLFFLGFIAIVAAGAGYYLYLVPQVANMTQQATTAQNDKAKIDSLNSQADSITAQVGPILSKVKFYQDVLKYNPQMGELYSRVARWTSPKIYYTSMAVSGSTLDIKGYTKSIADMGQYLQYMYTEPDVSSVTLTTALPSYSNAVYPVVLYKGHPLTAPPQQTGGFGGPGGGGAANFSFGGPTGPPGGFGQRGPYGGSQMGPPAAQQGSSTHAQDVLDLAEAGKDGYSIEYRHIDSFSFDVVCTLKQAYAPPAPPAGGGEAAGGGAAGGGGAAAGVAAGSAANNSSG